MAEHFLAGCGATPLLDYLKSLGLLQVLSQQADADCRGRWRDDRFVIETRLDEEELTGFLLGEYKPLPALAPWNRGSGFWDEKTAGKAVQMAEKSGAGRLAGLRRVIEGIRRLIRNMGYETCPEKEEKTRFIQQCRAHLPDMALEWLDSAAVLLDERVSYAALLGTGGNDGKLDFTANYVQRLRDVMDFESGAPTHDAAAWLRSSLWSQGAPTLSASAVGQFHPGGIGGANATAGFEGSSVVNPWDFLLALEGSPCLAGSTNRLLGMAGRGVAVFPFTVKVGAFGAGGLDLPEELRQEGRAEMWMPLWERPSGYLEIRRLFAEGRVQFGRKIPRTSLEFARAVRELGIDRGIVAFQRYAFVKRSGLAYVAASLDRIAVEASPDPGIALLREIDPWLERLASVAGSKNAPARFGSALIRIQRAIYAYATAPGERPFVNVLEELGRCESEIKGGDVPPLQGLSSRWADMADDGTSEFRIAQSLAGLISSEPELRKLVEPVDVSVRTRRVTWRPDFFAPGWTAGSLGRKLSTLLDRLRLAGHEPFPPVMRSARIGDVLRFLDGELDDPRVERLFFALLAVSTARPTAPSPGNGQGVPLEEIPLVYALAKTMCLPGFLVADARGRWRLRQTVPRPAARQGDTAGPAANMKPVRGGGRFHSLLKARRVGDALTLAVRSLRASGYPLMVNEDAVARGLVTQTQAERLAGAVLIPVAGGSRLANLVLKPPVMEEGVMK
jgi:CRISPR-associated protein Csx17